MVVIAYKTIREFALTHSDATNALNEWYHKVKVSDWENFGDMKRTFNSADFVGNDRYVFNIKGNQYRLVALTFFSVRTVYIRFIGTHAEYENIDVSTV